MNPRPKIPQRTERQARDEREGIDGGENEKEEAETRRSYCRNAKIQKKNERRKRRGNAAKDSFFFREEGNYDYLLADCFYSYLAWRT